MSGLAAVAAVALVVGVLSAPSSGSAASNPASMPSHPVIKKATPVAWSPPAAVNRTPSGVTPTSAWKPGVRLSGADETSSSPGTVQAASGPSGVAAPQAVSPAAGTGLGALAYYGLETFSLDPIDSLQAQVNLANGNLLIHANELKVNAPGLNLRLDRFYNSLATGSGAFGKGGVLSTGQDVGLQINASNVVFSGPSGFLATFTGTSTFTSPPGINATLVKNGGGTYTLTYNRTGEKLTFTSGGYLTSDADKNGNTMSLLYNGDNTIHTITDTAGRVTTFGYTSGRLTSITDASGRATSYGYTSGNLTSSVNADSATSSTATTYYTYNAGNQLTRIQTPASHYIDIGYDTSGRVSTVKRYLVAGSLTGGSVTTTFAYPSSTQTTETDAASHTTTYTIDSSGRVTAVQDALGDSRSVTWTANSDIATAVDAMGTGGTGGNTTTYSYDTNNNLTSVALPTGAAQKAQYANTSSPVGCTSSDTTHPYYAKCVEDAQGDQQALTYDTGGNVTQSQDTSQTPNSGVTKTYTYQGDSGVPSCGGKPGEQCSSKTGNGNTTAYAYNSNGDLTTVTPPSPGTATTYTYDSMSRLKTVKDPNGVTITYTYDARDQRTQTAYSTSGATIVYGYNADGERAAATDSVSGEEDYTYDGLGRELTDTPPGSSTATVTYDSGGNIATYADAAGTVTYSHNQANQLWGLAEPGGSCTGTVTLCTTFSYNANGYRTKITFPGPTIQTTTVDNSGRPTEIKAVYGSTTVSDLAYSYAKGSNDTELVQTRTDKVGVGAPANSVTTYGYDTLDRLTTATEKTSGGTGTETWTYGYDKDGNRTSSSDARPSAGVTAEVTAKAISSSGTITTPAFSTTSGSNQLLLALVSADGPGGSGTQTDTVTGAGLTWTLVTRGNAAGTGTSEIWKATPTTALSNVTVSASETTTGYSQALTVEAISGTSGVGASNHTSATTGAPGTSVTTTAANSLLFGVGNDGGTAGIRTPNSGQGITNEQDDVSNQNDEWTQKVQVPVPASSTAVTVGDLAPTGSGYNMAAAEVKAAAGGSTISQSAGYNAIDELTSLNGSTTGLSYDADGNETANPGASLKPGSAYAALPGRSSSYNDRDQQTGITPTGGDALTNYFLGEDNTKTTGVYDAATDTGIAFTNTMLGLINDNSSITGSREYLRTPDGLLVGAHVSAGCVN